MQGSSGTTWNQPLRLRPPQPLSAQGQKIFAYVPIRHIQSWSNSLLIWKRLPNPSQTGTERDLIVYRMCQLQQQRPQLALTLATVHQLSFIPPLRRRRRRRRQQRQTRRVQDVCASAGAARRWTPSSSSHGEPRTPIVAEHLEFRKTQARYSQATPGACYGTRQPSSSVYSDSRSCDQPGCALAAVATSRRQTQPQFILGAAVMSVMPISDWSGPDHGSRPGAGPLAAAQGNQRVAQCARATRARARTGTRARAQSALTRTADGLDSTDDSVHARTNSMIARTNSMSARMSSVSALVRLCAGSPTARMRAQWSIRTAQKSQWSI